MATDTLIDVLKSNLETLRSEFSDKANEIADVEARIRAAAPQSKDAADYRIVVSADDGMWWSSTEAMLDDVFGDTWCDVLEHDGPCVYGECTPDAYAQEYIDAFECTHDSRSGVYAFSASLEGIDPVSGEFESIDSCGGFYSADGCAPVDQIRDQLEPNGLNGKVDVSCE